MLITKNKATQNFILLTKILVVLLSGIYIFRKTTQEHLGALTVFESALNFNFWSMAGLLLLVFLLSVLNWLFEILKWKTLLAEIRVVSFKAAAFQSLIAHTVAVFTPNRIGDFGAKMLFFETEHRKRILGLNLISNVAQMAATILFGMLGLLLVDVPIFEMISMTQLNMLFWLIICSVGALLMLKHFFKNGLKSITAHLQMNRMRNIRVFIYSLYRYLLFSHQYFIIGCFLGFNVEYFTAMPLIFIVYFVASFLPSMFILDSALKAGIGVYLFSIVEVQSLVIVAISSIMWLLNFAFPALLGNLLMLQVKLKPSSPQTLIRIS